MVFSNPVRNKVLAARLVKPGVQFPTGKTLLTEYAMDSKSFGTGFPISSNGGYANKFPSSGLNRYNSVM